MVPFALFEVASFDQKYFALETKRFPAVSSLTAVVADAGHLEIVKFESSEIVVVAAAAIAVVAVVVLVAVVELATSFENAAAAAVEV